MFVSTPPCPTLCLPPFLSMATELKQLSLSRLSACCVSYLLQLICRKGGQKTKSGEGERERYYEKRAQHKLSRDLDGHCPAE